MIAGLAWVPPGAANPTLIEKELSVNEIEEMEKMDAQGLIGYACKVSFLRCIQC